MDHTKPLPSIAAVKARLLARHEVSERGCWVLRGCQNETYVSVTIEGVTFKAHQWSAYAWLGHPLRAGYTILVRHQCDYPPCFNPGHLLSGTYRDNWQDALDRGLWQLPTACPNGHEYTPETVYEAPGGIRKCRICMSASKRRWFNKVRAATGRQPMLTRSEASSAEHNGNHRLTWEQVRSIRDDRSAGMSVRAITEKYGIGKSQAYNIVNGRQWQEETGEAS